MYVSAAEDLSIGRASQWNNWPAHLTVPMMLLRETMEMKSYSSNLNNMKAKSTSPLNKSGALSVQLATGFECPACGRLYKLKSSLRNHQKWECGKEPQFKCPYCVYKAKQKMHVARHMERMHKPKEVGHVPVKDEQK
ncbi:longitudinals lacking [Carabus blaptoides fortunei]